MGKIWVVSKNKPVRFFWRGAVVEAQKVELSGMIEISEIVGFHNFTLLGYYKI